MLQQILYKEWDGLWKAAPPSDRFVAWLFVIGLAVVLIGLLVGPGNHERQ